MEARNGYILPRVEAVPWSGELWWAEGTEKGLEESTTGRLQGWEKPSFGRIHRTGLSSKVFGRLH